jgi:exosortase E/protease (VPEID-CTERM system)
MACILAVECIPVTVLGHPWLLAGTLTASVVFFFVALLFFGRERLRASRWDAPPIRKSWVAIHACSLALFVAANLYLLNLARPDTGMERGALWLWYGALALLPLTLGKAMFGLRRLTHLLRSLGSAWGLAAVCAGLMTVTRTLMMIAWNSPDSRFGQAMQTATFRGTKLLLGLFYTGVIADPATYAIGTRAFAVRIAGRCSGIEGLALMLSLTVGWLIFSRRELRVARALLLVPASLLLIWLLNLARIAALIAIGDAGYQTVAMGGFHSESGCILFSCVAIGFLIGVNSVSWFRAAAPASEANITANARSASLASGSPIAETNVAAVYLLPWLAILAAGLLSGAASDGFEWWYGLRLIAGLGALYAYRREYRRMDWRFGWLGPLAGVAVFALWIALDQWMGRSAIGSAAAHTAIAEGLARLSSGQRTAWIAARAISAVIVIPLADELAFRAYIARRLMSADVESTSLRRLSVVAILGSSALFGILQGRMWFAGIVAGLVFAGVAKLRGRLGEAVAAHATANLMIAAWALATGQYSLW